MQSYTKKPVTIEAVQHDGSPQREHDILEWVGEAARVEHDGDAKTTGFTFSEALDAVKAGKLVAREGWNGKNMFIFLVPGSHFAVSRPPLNEIFEEGTEVDYHGHVDMRTATGKIVPWLCSQMDMLSDGWTVVS